MMHAVLGTQPANDEAIFDELLRTMSEVLDVRAIFPRVSEVASRILPHDRLTMTFHHGQGHIGRVEQLVTADGQIALPAENDFNNMTLRRFDLAFRDPV